MNYTSVIFDLDGTLCDTMPDIHSSVNAMLRRRGYPERSFEHTTQGLNRGSRFLISHALPEGACDAEIDAALALYMSIYGDHLCDQTVPYDGITQLLSDLLRLGITLAILSNKPDAFVARLSEQLFPGAFRLTVGQGAYPVKPSPEAPLAIAQKLGVAPESILFVGDSDVDIITAHNAGMTAVGVTWGYRDRSVLVSAGADYIVDTPSDIYSIISNKKF